MNWAERLGPIEVDIPIPPKSNGAARKYPFRDMKVGDSFFISCPRWEHQKVFNSLTSCRKYASMKTGFRFTFRVVKDGIRVWRTA